MSTLRFVGIAVEYRLADYTSVSSLDCMKDAKSAVRWVRLYSCELNIDSNRILAIGQSAGGHLALSTLMFPRYIERGKDKAFSSVPNAVISAGPGCRAR